MNKNKRLFDRRKKTGEQLLKLVKIGCVLSIILLAFVRADHPYHVSYAEMNYNQDENTLEVAVRLFSNDLEQAVNQKNKNHVKLGGELSVLASEDIWNYMQKHFMLMDTNQNRLPAKLLGIESYPDNTWIYFYIEDIENNTAVVMENSVLFDLFDDQENRLKVTIGSSTKHLLFTPKTPFVNFLLLE